MTAVDNNDTLCACFYVLYLLRVEFSVLVKLSRKITRVDLPRYSVYQKLVTDFFAHE